MNNEIIEIIKSRNIHPISYTKKGGIYIVKEKKNAYVIKLNTNNYDVYKYLLSRDFLYFPENFSLKNGNYDMYEYIEDIKEEKEQKLEDLIVVLSVLHKKTSYLREIDLDEVKNIYEDIKEKIEKGRKYYLNLNDDIDKKVFLSPSEYLLVRNISLIYYSLSTASKYIDEWYREILNEKSLRVSFLHNNISLDHLIINDNKYLISWDKAYFNNPIYEIESIYRKYYYFLDLSNLLQIYEKNNKLNYLEYKLLISLLLIPEMVNITDNVILDTTLINDKILFLSKVIDFTKKIKIQKESKLSKN